MIFIAPFALKEISNTNIKKTESFKKHIDSCNNERQIIINNYISKQNITNDSIVKIRKSIYNDMNKVIARQNKLIKEMEQRLIMEEKAISNYYKVRYYFFNKQNEK